MASIKAWWARFRERHPAIARFIVFNLVGGIATLLQIVMLPVLKGLLDKSAAVNTALQIIRIGSTSAGEPVYMFDYPAGPISLGGGGGLAYFIAVEVTILSAQIVNFFLQRKVTFKSNGSVWKAIIVYLLAYVAITFGAAALQCVYKEPLYRLLMDTWAWGRTGETIADILVVLINCTVQFIVFYPLFHLLFRKKAGDEKQK